MSVVTYLIEYLDGSWEYILSRKFSKVFAARRNKKPVSYKKVVLTQEEAIRKGVIFT